MPRPISSRLAAWVRFVACSNTGRDTMSLIGTRGRPTGPENGFVERSTAETFLTQPGSPAMSAAPQSLATFFHRIIPVAAVAVMLLISTGAFTGCAASARFETTGGGHPISATVTGPLTIDSRETHATITTPSGTVTIERTRARIGDEPWQTIPEHVPVRVSMSTHTVSLHAGPVTISRTMR
jgi:hypothetical protein